MIQINNIKVGDKVHFKQTPDNKRFENGIVKEVLNDHRFVRVVYDYNNDIDNYTDYTSQLTDVNQLYEGWK